VVFWFTVFGSAICAGFQLATSSFHAVRWATVWILLGIGLCGNIAQLAMTRAYRTGNTLVCGALSYSTLVFGAIATSSSGTTPWSPRWVGMGVIIASGILAMRVEKKEQVEEAGFES
jgi:drug/metabolite transporter (DMT)-like permease